MILMGTPCMMCQCMWALIPYTLDFTNLGDLKVGDPVNLEFDILGKYVQKNLAHFQQR